MNKKRIIICCILFVVFLVVVGILIAINYSTHNTSHIMRFAIYPTGSDQTYYFTLDKDGVLKVEFGTRKKHDIKSIKRLNFMEEVRESSEKKLTEDELQNLMELANAVDFLNYNLKKHIVYGGNYIVFLYNGRIHEAHDAFDRDSIAFTALTEKFIELSPIQIKLSPHN